MRVLTAALLTLLTACSQEVVTPPRQPPPNPVAVWVTRQIDGVTIPAVVKSGIDEGVTWELRALADTLIVRANGTWEQRVRVRQTQSDGFVAVGGSWDRGEWTRSGNVLSFQSTWIENVSFRAELTAEELVVDHDFTLDDGAAMRRQMRR